MDTSKIERLSVTLLERDKIALRQLAQSEGEAMAVVVRKLIRSAAAELTMPGTGGEREIVN